MAIQFKFFSIPIPHEAESEAELNRFLNGVRLINRERKLVQTNTGTYWAIALEYDTEQKADASSSSKSKKKIDYRETLSPEDFQIFSCIRSWRNELAKRNGWQIYNIFDNEQIAIMAEQRIVTKEGLLKIKGVGESRVEKYGDTVIGIIKEEIGKIEQKDGSKKKPLPTDTGV